MGLLQETAFIRCHFHKYEEVFDIVVAGVKNVSSRSKTLHKIFVSVTLKLRGCCTLILAKLTSSLDIFM